MASIYGVFDARVSIVQVLWAFIHKQRVEECVFKNDCSYIHMAKLSANWVCYHFVFFFFFDFAFLASSAMSWLTWVRHSVEFL